MEGKTLPKYASIPLGVACFASAAILVYIGIALVSGKATFSNNA